MKAETEQHPKATQYLAVQRILEERRKQDEKWGEQNRDPYTYLAILIEEVGELAQAILQTKFGGDKGGTENIFKEAVHVAAVGLAIVECLLRNTWEWNL